MNVPERRTLGAAIQRGLMFATGYFADWSFEPYPPDWAVTEYRDLGPGEHYRYVVRIFNLNRAPGEYGHVSTDRIPSIDWRYRFELCPGAEGSLQ